MTDDLVKVSLTETPKTWICVDLGMLDYQVAWDLQLRLVAARKSGALALDLLLLLEHPPVFTLGRRGGREHLTVAEELLLQSQIPLLHAERGGDITFHGPGQLVGYPIMDLHAAKLTVTDYVERLEEVMIRTAVHFGVPAGRSPLNRGTWVGASKLGSIGIAIRRGITFHGFALNVNISLDPFCWINPCGLKGITMTSLARELSHELPMEDVRSQVKRDMQTVFQADLRPASPTFLDDLLNESAYCSNA